MRIVKLIAGIILFAAGLFIGIAVIVSLSKLRVDFSNTYGISYFAGGAIMSLILTAFSFFMMKYGARLTKKKN
jgi:hypothetical protein